MATAKAEAVTLHGPMRHKIGGCKPQGAGTAWIQLKRMALRRDALARYRGPSTDSALEGDILRAEVEQRVQPWSRQTDPTMTALRAMLLYSKEDPRAADLDYPTFQWFKDNSQTPLKPVR